jgi:hypothetical protein
VDDGGDEHVDENKDDQRIEIPRSPVQRKQLESWYRKLIHGTHLKVIHNENNLLTDTLAFLFELFSETEIFPLCLVPEKPF